MQLWPHSPRFSIARFGEKNENNWGGLRIRSETLCQGIGEQFALIVQARAISGKEVHAVVHCPECKVMLWEPLILTLRAFLNEHSKEDAKTLSVVNLSCTVLAYLFLAPLVSQLPHASPLTAQARRTHH